MKTTRMTVGKLIEILLEFDKDSLVFVRDGDRFGDRIVITKLNPESRTRITKSKTYHTWMSMKQRCINPNLPSYKNYGGRGIKVCERWKTFRNFVADMGEKPEGTSIERIDVNGNYEPSNCRWATPIEQANNKRNCRFIEWQGERFSIAQLARKYDLSYQVLRNRIENNWPLDKALHTPIASSTQQPQKPRKYDVFIPSRRF